MSKIPTPLVYLWAAITLPVVIIGGSLAYEIHNLQNEHVVSSSNQAQVVVPTVSVTLTASPSATPTVTLPVKRVVVPVITSAVK